jgi:ABC-type uncharacterized transport system permease subunit
MKSTSIILFILAVIAAVCLVFMSGFFEEGNTLFIISCVVFLIVGIVNLVVMIEKKTNKKFLLIHIAPLIMFLVMAVYFMVKMKNDGGIYIIPYLLPYLIPHILSFGALLCYIEYITRNQIKDKRIADLEAENERLKG